MEVGVEFVDVSVGTFRFSLGVVDCEFSARSVCGVIVFWLIIMN